MKTLREMEPGERGRVMKVSGRKGIRRRLMDMGVVSGAEVTVERVAPLGDPVEIRLKGYYLAIRLEEAENIQLETDGDKQ